MVFYVLSVTYFLDLPQIRKLLFSVVFWTDRCGDQVMADKGFNCQDELASVGASLVMPALLDKKVQFSKEETNHNKVVASLRVHVERLMERIKNWHIFDHKIPITLAPSASDMIVVVCALSNFQTPLIN